MYSGNGRGDFNSHCLSYSRNDQAYYNQYNGVRVREIGEGDVYLLFQNTLDDVVQVRVYAISALGNEYVDTTFILLPNEIARLWTMASRGEDSLAETRVEVAFLDGRVIGREDDMLWASPRVGGSGMPVLITPAGLMVDR